MEEASGGSKQPDIRYDTGAVDVLETPDIHSHDDTKLAGPYADLQSINETEQTRLLENFQNSRNKYAYLCAGRASRTFHFGSSKRFNRKAVAEAKEAFKISRVALIGHEVMMAYDSGEGSGITDLQEIGARIAADYDESLAQATDNEHLVATREYDYAYEYGSNSQPSLDSQNKTVIAVHSRPRGVGEKYLRRIHSWWGAQSDGSIKGVVKKVAVTAGLGTVAAASSLAAAPAVGAAVGIGGTIAAVGILTRVSKSSLVFHLDKQSSTGWYFDRLKLAVKDTITDNYQATDESEIKSVADLIEARVAKEAKSNHTRAAIGAAAVIGGTLLGELLHFATSGHGSVLSKQQTNNVAPKPRTTSPLHPHSTLHPRKPTTKFKPSLTRSPGVDQTNIKASQIGDRYISDIYEHAEGLHRGFSDMTHAANAAIKQGQLLRYNPDPSNPNLFWYKVTQKGATMFAKGAAESDKSVDVMRVLSHYGRVSILNS